MKQKRNIHYEIKYFIFISLFILVAFYFLLKDPIKRKLESNRNLLEQNREIKIFRKKIKFFLKNEENIQKVKVHDLLYEIFGESKIVVSFMQKEQLINEIKDLYELKMLEIFMSETKAIADKNMDVINIIEKLPEELIDERKELIDIVKKRSKNKVMILNSIKIHQYRCNYYTG